VIERILTSQLEVILMMEYYTMISKVYCTDVVHNIDTVLHVRAFYHTASIAGMFSKAFEC
jgi:hypothetical protein